MANKCVSQSVCPRVKMNFCAKFVRIPLRCSDDIELKISFCHLNLEA